MFSTHSFFLENEQEINQCDGFLLESLNFTSGQSHL